MASLCQMARFLVSYLRYTCMKFAIFHLWHLDNSISYWSWSISFFIFTVFFVLLFARYRTLFACSHFVLFDCLNMLSSWSFTFLWFACDQLCAVKLLSILLKTHSILAYSIIAICCLIVEGMNTLWLLFYPVIT